MIYQGYQKLAAPSGIIEGAGFLTRLIWALQGVVKVLGGASLDYGIDTWYWNPSRVIPTPPDDTAPITEFPFFTVLYGDPHAHLFAMPLTLLAVSWALSVLLGKAWLVDAGEKKGRSFFQVALGMAFGGLAIGVLRPTNTWDLPTYLAIGAVAVGYVLWRTYSPERERWAFLSRLPVLTRRFIVTVGGMIVLVALSILFFQPFAQWYVQGYTAVDFWKGSHTSVSAYFTHWGLFLFVIVAWMGWETREWMASTPLASLRKFAPYRIWIQGGVVLLLAAVAGLLFLGVRIAWLVLPLAVWAGVLIFRPGMPDGKRAVLFLVGTGLFLTLLVEVIVLRGDIGRMNTVFKFYLQAWTLFAISAGAALGWLLSDLPAWLPGWRTAFQFGLAVLVASASLYTVLASTAKMKDRMAPAAPHTLEGMTFMRYATWGFKDAQLNLNHDYNAIRWMQENVPGSPVLVEANLFDLYLWGNRFTVYTGLPGVVGWNWHERQQRVALDSQVWDRGNAVDDFYMTEDISQARIFLEKYNVSYIVVGQLERANYLGPGLDKFDAYDGSLWNAVYREGDTVIYRVNSVAVALQSLP
jgi:YYY domain-containing protein